MGLPLFDEEIGTYDGNSDRRPNVFQCVIQNMRTSLTEVPTINLIHYSQVFLYYYCTSFGSKLNIYTMHIIYKSLFIIISFMSTLNIYVYL